MKVPYIRHPNRALRNFFLLSVALHIMLLFFIGQRIQSQKPPYRIEVDLKVIPPSRHTSHISRPTQSLSHMNRTPLLRSQLPSMANPSALKKASNKTPDAINTPITPYQPDPVSYNITPVHLIKKGIQDIPTSRIPKFMKPTSSRDEQTQPYVDLIKGIIKSRIQELLKYPLAARRRGLEGTVHLEFLLFPDGNLGEIRITKSSNYPILDHAATETIKAGSPYPPFHGDLKKYQDGVWIPYKISFKLE